MDKRQVEVEARRRVDAVWEDPQGRLAMRQAFYQQYPGTTHTPYGDGRSEIAFLEWEIARGVLAPSQEEQPGSAWWKSTNGDFLYFSELASLAAENGLEGEDWPTPVQHWLDYIATPSDKIWYRAHNTSIIQGYLNNIAQARIEDAHEQSFINIVLYRLLYAQALVMDQTRFGKLGEVLARPDGGAVELMVHMTDFYPANYPMTEHDYREVTGQCFDLEDIAVRILDNDFILPQLDELYAAAAEWNNTPQLVRLAHNGKAIYPQELLPPPLPGGPKKIAILGGGIAALTTAWELTSYPGWQNDYEITLHQLGWRCGGKMRGGRGPHGRVEELGLHLLLGFYVNAFPLFQEVYAERKARGLAPESPYQALTDAILPNNSTLLVNYNSDQCRWQNWPLIFPPSPGYPGDGPPLNTWQLLNRGVAILLVTLLGSPYANNINPLFKWILSHFYPVPPSPEVEVETPKPTPPKDESAKVGWLDHIVQQVERGITEGIAYVEGIVDDVTHEAALAVSQTLGFELRTMRKEGSGLLEDLLYYMSLIQKELEKLLAKANAAEQRLHHLAMLFNFGTALLQGMLKDVWNPNTGKFEYRKINHLDFRAWLRSHGATEATLFSPIVTFFYTGTFEALDDGEQQGGLLAAGTALQFALPALGYKGAFCFQLRLGTPDTLVMPLYQVLRARGVTFSFFHNVTNIAYTSDTRIERIDLEQQVELTVDQYDPVIWVKGNPAWPSTPQYEQINPEQARQLIEQHIDLEDPWSGWTGTPRSLELGKDFDEVILGIPSKAQATICREIIDARPDWGEMVANIGTAQVMSAQLWFAKSLEELGFHHADWGLSAIDNAPNVVTYANPMFSWLDQSEIIENEDWPEALRPKVLAMFTGILPPTFFGPKGAVDPDYMESQRRRVIELTWQWLMDNMGYFFRDARPPAYPAGLDLQTLQAIKDGDVSGREKFIQQFFTCAVAPADQYVIAVPNTEQYRKTPGGSGFDNLFLVGDWTDYGTNIGYMEGCVVSAHKAVEALMSRLGRDTLRPYWRDELADWD